MAKKKILLIDDEQDFLDVEKKRLEANGYDVITALDGREGLNKAQTEAPDLVILDILLPEMDGYDVCRKLKIDKRYKDIPVIIYTARFEPHDIKLGKEMGADAYITKPFEAEVLLNKIKELLNRNFK